MDAHTMNRPAATPKVSVIIPNYNYQQFVGAAIDSALNLDWPDVEVIVIDDGSTDGSRAVIAGYGTRILTILQPNSGQLVACNQGLAASHGEIVIFLDSDDVLGSLFPQYAVVPTPEQVRRWFRTTAAYPTPPGSGNAYSRWFLDCIFPLQNSCGTANDSYCLAAAPLLGDVLTVARPLVSYRIHGRNQGALSRLDLHQFERQMTRGRQRLAYARGIAARVGIVMSPNAIDRSLGDLCYRVASLKLAPAAHPVAGDSALRVMADVAAAMWAPQGVGLKARLTLLAWACAVFLAPAALARQLVLWRFAPGTRPQALRHWLVKLRVVRA